eukprot:2148328-Amphidinium_carterae.2
MFPLWAAWHAPKDAPWAITATMDGKSCPIDNRCMECVHLYANHFAHLSWSDFLSQKQGSGGYVNDAIGFMAQKTLPSVLCGFTPSSVLAERSVEVSMSKPYVVMTGRDIKKLLGVEKVNKADVKDIPMVVLPSEQDPSLEEETFWFRDESQVGRRGEVTVKMVGALHEHHLDATHHQWHQQANHMMRHVASVEGKAKGLHAMLNKQKLLTIDEFKMGYMSDTKKKKKSDGSYCTPQHLAGVSDDIHVDDEDDDLEEEQLVRQAMGQGQQTSVRQAELRDADEVPLSTLGGFLSPAASTQVSPVLAGLGVKSKPKQPSGPGPLNLGSMLSRASSADTVSVSPGAMETQSQVGSASLADTLFRGSISSKTRVVRSSSAADDDNDDEQAEGVKNTSPPIVVANLLVLPDQLGKLLSSCVSVLALVRWVSFTCMVRGDLVDQYKTTKVPMLKILSRELDHRKVTGMSNKVNVLLASKAHEKHLLGQRLNNYLKDVNVCQELADGDKLKVMDDTTLATSWGKVKSELREVPESFVANCLSRRVQKLRDNMNWGVLVKIVSPWHAETVDKDFDPLSVTMHDQRRDLDGKLKDWSEAIFQSCLESLIAEGEHRALQVEAFCKQCDELYTDELLMDMEGDAALVLGAAKKIWKALLCLKAGDPNGLACSLGCAREFNKRHQLLSEGEGSQL